MSLPSYSARNSPRRCNSGTTSSTKSSHPPGRYPPSSEYSDRLLVHGRRRSIHRATWVCDSAEMAQEVCVTVSAEDRSRLAAIIEDRNRPLKHIQRAQIILFSADRLPVLQVARRTGTSRPAVWRWQKRYAEAGVEGLLRDKTRPPGR